jgi:ribosomal protein S13
MFKYKDVVFSIRGNLVDSLKKIFGIGLSRAFHMLDSLGISRRLKTMYMNHYYYSHLVFLLKSRYLLDNRLKELHLQRLEFFFSQNFVKGLRLFDGLPLKGRTHANGSTASRLKPFSEKYNEEILSRYRRILLYAKTRLKKRKR